MSKIQKSMITFTVLHRAEDDPEMQMHSYAGPYDNPLGFAMQEAWDGGMVGQEGEATTMDVPPEEVANELIALGNDGTFFDDDLEEA